ncbi:AAA family ATPase [Asticcacaulis sp. AC402]|uniref:AAA family ATPase n=1 Tax=Asticcacaulis sp. AC402 TaxID=1282361 RepID=UPI0003C3DF73|nr:AAA family ATPase [Asticcacaulis sp. AC402]ESQ76186.1 hypothetical protein ABAC402_06965 [Asticcacaulis sp. AC402]
MRVNRLDLVRYGRFTDFSLSFGAKPLAGPDLHIIYGPNEAGKSTTYAGLLDLLYGIEKRSKYDFKHPYATMRLSGAIELNGAESRFIRVKKDHNSLLDEHENPVADGAILAELGGLDRQAFQTMFSLDDKSLEAGGEEILASKGELGELLFSASSGLSSLSRHLGEVRQSCDQFFKPRGSTHDLARLKKELDALRHQRDQLDTVASEFVRLVETRDRADAHYQATAAELARQRADLERLRRLARAHPKRLAWHNLKAEIAPLHEIPEAPSRWSRDIRELVTKGVQIETAMLRVAAQLNGVAEDLGGIVVDEKRLGLMARIDDLKDLRARYVTSEKDLPVRRSRRRDLEIAMSQALKRMYCDEGLEIDTLLLSPVTRGHLEDLMPQFSALDERLAAAQTEYEAAEEDLRTAQTRQGALSNQRTPLTEAQKHELASAIEAVRTADFPTLQRLAQEDLRTHGDVLKVQMGDVRPWNGGAEGLRDLVVPLPYDLSCWRSEHDMATARLAELNRDIDRDQAKAGEIASQLDALNRVSGVVTQAQAREVRRDRDTAWETHKASLDPVSAARFEALLHRDDEIAAGRISQASDFARVTELSVQLAAIQSALADATTKRDNTRLALANLQATVSAAIAKISPDLSDGWPIDRLQAWLARRDEAMKTQASIERCQTRLANAAADETRCRIRLAAAMAAAGLEGLDDLPIEVLLAKAADRLESDTRLASAAEELDRFKRNTLSRQVALEKATAERVAWKASWTALCASCWLGQVSPDLTVEIVRQLLKELDLLASQHLAKSDLDHRISAMEADQRAYAESVNALALEAGVPPAETPIKTDEAICAAVEAEKALKSAQQNAQKRFADLQAELETLTQARALHSHQAAAMTQHFGVDTLDEVEDRLFQLKARDEAAKRARDYEIEILETVEAATMEEAEAELTGFDPAQCQVDMERLAQAVADGDSRVRDLFAERSKAEDRINQVGGDAAVARLEEERRTLLLVIEDGAVNWLKLKLGVAATEQALRLYRDEHRSSLLVKASEAFSIVSRKAYRGLSTQYEKDSEVLVALCADGTSKLASELSKGTRFQLYLALRVAGYQAFVADRRSVPFIADDILETFDDFRAEETFGVFAEMAKAGQVIYLTHHKHLCDIASKVCPTLTIHELV